MIDKQQSDTLSLIGIIIKLTKDIDINQFNSVISESENFNFNLKTLIIIITLSAKSNKTSIRI